MYIQKEKTPSQRKESPKTMQEELKLQLEEKPKHNVNVDRPVKLPSAPSKVILNINYDH